jgi:hypothetical protein
MLRKVHIPVMLGLFLAGALIEAVRLTSLSTITNGDVWWHLSSGLWILQNHGLPHNGIFSQAASSAWTPVSWGYDLLLAALYQGLDLRAIPALLMCFKVGLATVTFLLAGGLRGKSWTAFALSAVAQYLLVAFPPSPAYFSILCFGIELLLLFESRRRPVVLYWLPPLFLLWANSDSQFVYGIGLMVLFLVMIAIAERLQKHPYVPVMPALIAAGLAMVASLITPHLWEPYRIFFQSVTSAANPYLPDSLAMSFHRPQDYVLLLLTMGAFLAVGRRQLRDPFQIVLLSLAAMLSFYAQHNVWIVALVAVAIIGDAIPSGLAIGDGTAWNRRALATAAVSVVLLLAAIVLLIPRRRDVLLAKVAKGYPVAAGDYIREHQLPQPLFNAYEWGGFLTWYLPQYPVAVDGRTDLYGDDFIVLYSKAMNADVPYTAFPAMAGARTLLFPKNSILGEALSTLPRFKVAYRDDVGLVLTREDETEASY